MTQVKEMTNERLNIALSKLMGRTEATAVMVNYDMIKKYCEDPAASLEVQAAAIAKDALGYVQALANVMVIDIRSRTLYSISRLLTASPRERAEAAYLTLSQVSGE